MVEKNNKGKNIKVDVKKMHRDNVYIYLSNVRIKMWWM